VVLARDPDEVRAHLDGLAPAGGSAGDAGAGLLLPFRYDGTWLGVAMVLFAAEWRGDDQDLRDLSHAGALVGQSLERLRLQETLRRLATSDALTGLPNRRALRERLEQALDRSERDDTPLVVVFVDLDGFKASNDRLGHAAGDLALTAAAARLRSAVRTADVVARLGGDEFVVLSEGGGPDDVRHLVERLHAALGEPFEIDGEPVTLAASIGVAARGPGDPPTSADQLLDRADGQMYAVKAARRRGR
jgi:diguanylate cyclase (GGDEF)-like protein